jgi:hypothetical protein
LTSLSFNSITITILNEKKLFLSVLKCLNIFKTMTYVSSPNLWIYNSFGWLIHYQFDLIMDLPIVHFLSQVTLAWICLGFLRLTSIDNDHWWVTVISIPEKSNWRVNKNCIFMARIQEKIQDDILRIHFLLFLL